MLLYVMEGVLALLSFVNAYALLTTLDDLVLNSALGESKQSVVRTDSDINAGMNLGSSLSYNNVACLNDFTAELLDAEAL